MQKCSYCGADLPENTRFCGKCGRVQDDIATYAATARSNTPQPQSWAPEGGTIPATWPPYSNYSAQGSTPAWSPNVQVPTTPPPAAENEDERRKGIPPRSHLYDVALGGDALLGSGQAYTPGALGVQGTPQIGSVPSIGGHPGRGPASAQGSASVPVGHPGQGSANAPVGHPGQGPASTRAGHPGQGPASAPVGHPGQGSANAPVGHPGQGSANAPVGHPGQGSAHVPISHPVQGPVNAAPVGQGPVNAPVGHPVQGPVNAPVSHPVSGPGNAPVSHPVQGPTNTPISHPVQGPQPTHHPPEQPGTQKHHPPHKPHRHHSHPLQHGPHRVAHVTKVAGGSAVKTIILVVTAMVVVAAGGIAAATHFLSRPQPLISITSNYKVGNALAGANGTILHISGQKFSSNSAITFLLDGQLAPGNPGTRSDSNGNFSADVTITNAWSVGTHTLTARDANNDSTNNSVSVTIVQPGQANTPGPDGAPPDDASFRLNITVQGSYSDIADPFASNPVLIITGHPDPEGGTVCSPDDSDQSFTRNSTGYNSGTPYTQVTTATCSGTYKAGQISYIETDTSAKGSFQSNGVNVNCVLNNPTIDLRLTGAYTGNNTFSGTFNAPYIPYICDQQGYSFYQVALKGTWTGTIVT